MDVVEIAKKINEFTSTLSSIYVGRERTIRVAMLSLISKQHLYIVGPPGTGKSMFGRMLSNLGFSFSYYLYGYDTKLEDVLYNVVISKNAQEGVEKLKVEYELKPGGIGNVEVHFADEMFKAPTPVLNALLSLMNERIVTLGSNTFKVPLWTLISASNEIPSDAPALVDRFLYREFHRYLSKETWLSYLTTVWNIHSGYKPKMPSISKDVFKTAHKLIPTIEVLHLLDTLVDIFDQLSEKSIEISDRRKGQILVAIASSAIMDGRTFASIEDLEIIRYTVPKSEDELEVVDKVLNTVIGEALTIKRELDSIESKIDLYINNVSNANTSEIVGFITTSENIKNKLMSIDYNEAYKHRIDRISRKLTEALEISYDELAKRLVGDTA